MSGLRIPFSTGRYSPRWSRFRNPPCSCFPGNTGASKDNVISCANRILHVSLIGETLHWFLFTEVLCELVLRGVSGKLEFLAVNVKNHIICFFNSLTYFQSPENSDL